MSNKLRDKDIDEIAGMLGNAQPGSINHAKYGAELSRRQAVAQINATRIMWLTLVVIALTSTAAAAFQFLAWYAPRIPT